MPQHTLPSNNWYEKTGLVVILCLVFFPVGLYALWKNTTISKGAKITVTIIIGLVIIANIGRNNTVNSTAQDTPAVKTQSIQPTEHTKSTPVATDVPEETTSISKEDAEKDAVIKKLKAKAKRDWPNDYTTQEYWVNQEIEDYEYMLAIENNSIKRQAQRDWPLDFTTQKFWYNEQIEAKERMQ